MKKSIATSFALVWFPFLSVLSLIVFSLWLHFSKDEEHGMNGVFLSPDYRDFLFCIYYCLCFFIVLLSLVIVIHLIVWEDMNHSGERDVIRRLFTYKCAHSVPLTAYIVITILTRPEAAKYDFIISVYPLLLFAGMYGFFSMLVVAKGGRIRLSTAYLVGILQFVIVLDIVAVFLLWLKTRLLDTPDGEVLSVRRDTLRSPLKKIAGILNYVFLLPVILLPYVIFEYAKWNLSVYPYRDRMPQDNLLLAYPVALVSAMLFIFFFLLSGHSLRQFVWTNLILRLLQLPGYVLLLCFSTHLAGEIIMIVLFYAIPCLWVTAITGGGVAILRMRGKNPQATHELSYCFVNYFFFISIWYSVFLVIRYGKRPSDQTDISEQASTDDGKLQIPVGSGVSDD